MFKSLALLLVLALATPGLSEEAKVGQFPWHAALNFTIGSEMRVCSGVIIDRKFILTTAQCTHGASSVTMQLGALSYESDGTEYKVSSSEFISHDSFNAETLENNIALVRLPELLDTDNENIQGLSIVPPNIKSFSRLLVSGWGMLCDGTEEVKCISKLLSYAEASEVPHEECEKIYVPLSLPNITEQNMCTRFSAQADCIVDSGSPLVDLDSKTPGLVGIVSYANPEGCQQTNPIVYTHISEFCAWLSEKTEKQMCMQARIFFSSWFKKGQLKR